MAKHSIPFLKPNPAKMSEQLRAFEEIEARGIYSNFGPHNTRFETEMIERLFDGVGGGLTVCNATIGLMVAIREAVDARANPRAKYALVPSFTFAATPHAAMWCGLTPILYDIEPGTWLPSRREEDRLLDHYGDEVGVVIPYATFGNNLQLARYDALAQERGVPVVVDAAASLGSIDVDGNGFGTGSSISIVYSMHVTKTFSASEGGFIYSADQNRIQRMRTMSNFGFSEPRSAGMAGLNAKLSEIGAVGALAKLRGFDVVVARRRQLYDRYVAALGEFEFQVHTGRSIVSQFVPLLLPDHPELDRDKVVAGLAERGVMTANYFSPHIAEQPYFQKHCLMEELPETQNISRRIISLPIFDTMTDEQVDYVAAVLVDIVGRAGVINHDQSPPTEIPALEQRYGTI